VGQGFRISGVRVANNWAAEIGFLLTESERPSVVAEAHHFHPENAGIKIAGHLNVGHGQYKVINAIDTDHIAALDLQSSMEETTLPRRE
jgi:hypothetical protein